MCRPREFTHVCLHLSFPVAFPQTTNQQQPSIMADIITKKPITTDFEVPSLGDIRAKLSEQASDKIEKEPKEPLTNGSEPSLEAIRAKLREQNRIESFVLELVQQFKTLDAEKHTFERKPGDDDMAPDAGMKHQKQMRFKELKAFMMALNGAIAKDRFGSVEPYKIETFLIVLEMTGDEITYFTPSPLYRCHGGLMTYQFSIVGDELTFNTGFSACGLHAGKAQFVFDGHIFKERSTLYVPIECAKYQHLL